MNNSTADKLTVGVIGGTGYTGGELCRLLLGHPAVEVILPTSREPRPFARTHPNLRGSGLEFRPVERLEEQAVELDVVFFCTPSGEAMNRAGHFLDRGVRVVDLSADFRFRDVDLYQRIYGREHTAAHLLPEAAYGVTELNRDRVRDARLIANPGCYAITAILALTPLLNGGFVDLTSPLSIHATNGTTGAGTTPKKAIMHAEVAESMLAYSLEGHRHGPELEAFLSNAIQDPPVRVDINTAHGNFARGIHLQANAGLRQRLDRDQLLETFTAAYGPGHEGEHFVLVNDVPKQGGVNEKEYDVYPSLGHVVGSNFCHLGVDVDRARGIAKVVAVTDNLVKGAAGSAIQNMNVLFGLDETLGLRTYAL
ncbi:N-acetyl-gamma-glutamyl-phosphate reductase [Saccharopolyspora pogona]|uniref:N-acetyl-gamma-glutamyl-phosphate reductase n=1 Tax=Saccharopolyspora pogona TaxID=333966 RepID=UPI0016834CCB|nr:N-acetyl-gamma-glutamyl-phosphate reductase [Saccharopolyspora pogona]